MSNDQGMMSLRCAVLRMIEQSPEASSRNIRERQEITWTFECPIAPHLGSLLNREIRDVERLRLWFRSIGRDPIWGTLGPQIVQLISCRSLSQGDSPLGHWLFRVGCWIFSLSSGFRQEQCPMPDPQLGHYFDIR